MAILRSLILRKSLCSRRPQSSSVSTELSLVESKIQPATGGFEDVNDVVALDGFERSLYRNCVDGNGRLNGSKFGDRNLQFVAAGQNDGAFDEILKFADVAWKIVRAKRVDGLARN